MPSTWRMTLSKSSILVLCLALLALAACTPGNKAAEELRPEIEKLKTDIKALQDKTAQLEAAHQEIMKLLLKPEPVSLTPAPPATGAPLTVSQLLRERERFQGTRITVKGMPGTVLVHHKTLLLKAPEGVVEVYFGSLPDAKTVNRLSSTTLDQPLTVTGFFNIPAKTGGNLRITAEAVEF